MNIAIEYNKFIRIYNIKNLPKTIYKIYDMTYSISKEIAPFYSMGSIDPRSYSINKPSITGTIKMSFEDLRLLEKAINKHHITDFIFMIGRKDIYVKDFCIIDGSFADSQITFVGRYFGVRDL